nr:unnamed protein product [Callosobruchus analis]
MTKQMICEYDCMVFTESFRILDASIFKLPIVCKQFSRYTEETKLYKLQKKLDKLIKGAKYNYYKTQINKNKDNSKNLWKVINNICEKSSKVVPSDVITVSNTVCNTPDTIANAFNDFFSEIGKCYAEKIVKPSTPLPDNELNQNSFFLQPVTEADIITIINSLKTNKSLGIDDIKSEILRYSYEFIAAPLCHLINQIFISSKVPQQFKTAVVTPIHKKGDIKVINNYRPISIISSLAKIFEKSLKNRLEKFLNVNGIISDKQYGFRQGRSTNDAIGKLVTEIAKELEFSKPVICVFLDLAKAFDTVNHEQMLGALENAGVRGMARELFESYLENRLQVVKINNVYSKQQKINYGLPQGTVLGPVLFTIYINSILESHSTGRILSFADDTAIIYSDCTWDTLKRKVEDDLARMFDLFSHKILTINYEKTVFMPFSNTSRFLPHYRTLSIKCATKNILLNTVITYKYLGLTIDSHLRWHDHATNLTKTLRQLLYRFKYLKNILDLQHLKIIYYSLVEDTLF